MVKLSDMYVSVVCLAANIDGRTALQATYVYVDERERERNQIIRVRLIANRSYQCLWCNLTNLPHILLIYSRTVLLIKIETEQKTLSFVPGEKKRKIFAPSLSLSPLFSSPPSSITKMKRERKTRRFVIFFIFFFSLSPLLTHIY